MHFVPYGSGTVNGYPVQHGVYTDISGSCFVGGNGNLLRITSQDGTRTDVYEICDGRAPYFVKTISNPKKKSDPDFLFDPDFLSERTDPLLEFRMSSIERAMRPDLKKLLIERTSLPSVPPCVIEEESIEATMKAGFSSITTDFQFDFQFKDFSQLAINLLLDIIASDEDSSVKTGEESI
jgi:hypothetical protein